LIEITHIITENPDIFTNDYKSIINKSVKVAISINTSWNILNFRSGIVKELIRHGHEVYTISPVDSATEKLEALGCKSYPIELENSGMNVFSDYKYYQQFQKALSHIKPDAVLSYTIKPNIYGSIACGKMQIPVINNVSGLGTAFLWNKALKSVVQGLYKYAFKNSSHIFFQNKHDKQLFLDEVKINDSNTSILPGSGVDTNYFSPDKSREPNSEFTFLMISRLLIDKGIEEYCQAAEELRKEGINARFQILGKAEEGHKRGFSKEKIEQLASKGTIEYLGTTNDVRTFIRKADCVVLPSYREGTSRTLLEAASMAKPMVATDVPGCNNVVENGVNGLLCKVRDAQSLKNTLRKMSKSDQETLEYYANNSRKKALTEFDEQIVIDQYLEKIAEITSQKVKKSNPKEEVLI